MQFSRFSGWLLAMMTGTVVSVSPSAAQILALASGSTSAGAAVNLNLSLSGSSSISALQFTLSYTAAEFTAMSATIGSAASAAGKSVRCASGSGRLTCIVYGINATSIGSGVAAVVSATPSTSGAASRTIQVTTPVAVSGTGSAVAITATGGTVQVSGSTTPPPPPPTSSGLVLSLGLNEGSGSVAADASGAGNPGAASGTQWGAGKYGNALVFNGTSAGVVVNDANSLDLTSAMTLEAWVRPTATFSNWRAVIEKGGGAYSLHATTGANHPAKLPVNVWSHLALTYDGAMMRLYVNGVPVDGGSARTGAITTSAAALYLGRNESGDYFPGSIDEVRVYNRALTQAQIQADMNTPIGGAAVTPVLSSLLCTPSTLGPSASATCTVTMSAAVSASTAVSLSDNSAALTVPASVSIAAGQASATFSATAGALTADSSAVVTASYSGTSRTANIALVAAPTLLSLNCTPSTLASGNSATCTVVLSKTAPANTVVTLADNQAALTTPASVTVAAGQSSASFTISAGTVSTQQTATVTATLSGSTVSRAITLQAQQTISGLAAAYAMNENSGATVNDTSGNRNTGTASNTQWAQGRNGRALVFNGSSSGVLVNDANSLDLTAGMTLEAWVRPTATFANWRAVIDKASAYSLHSTTGASHPGKIPVNAWSHLALTYDGAMMRLYVNGQPVDGGTPRTGAITASSAPLYIGRSASGDYFPGTIDDVRIYNRALTQAQIQADMNTPVSTTLLTQSLGSGERAAALRMDAGSEERAALEGDTVLFPVTLPDGVEVTATELPEGARFDPATGEFVWTPGADGVGEFDLEFTFRNAAGEEASKVVRLNVMPAQPELRAVLHGATREGGRVCSPNALAIVQGAGLGNASGSEPLLLQVNGQEVSLVRQSATEIAFECPALLAGIPLQIQAKRGDRRSNVLESEMAEASPGVFSVEEGEDGGEISLLATGLGNAEFLEAGQIQVKVGEVVTQAAAVERLSAGVYRVRARLPEVASFGETIPVRIVVGLLNGQSAESVPLPLVMGER